MSASLFGNRFASLREPAWHGLGTVFQERKTALEVLDLAGLDYKIIAQRGLTVENPVNPTGPRIAIPGQVLFREPLADNNELRYLATVSDQYTVLQNRDIAEVLNPLTDVMPVETAGALHHGETVFFTLDGGTDQVRGEDVSKFWVITDRRDGDHAMRALFTTVRVVCQNTLSMAFSDATVNIGIPHTPGVRNELDFQVKMIAQMREVEAKILAQYREMAMAKLVKKQVEEIIAAAFPEPKTPRKVNQITDFRLDLAVMEATDPDLAKKFRRAGKMFELTNTRMEQYRINTMELYDRLCDEYPTVGGTAWAAYNAVVEYIDWGLNKTTNQPQEKLNESIIWGDRSKVKIKAAVKALAIARKVNAGKALTAKR